jgi:hypothetical protein
MLGDAACSDLCSIYEPGSGEGYPAVYCFMAAGFIAPSNTPQQDNLM